MINSKELLGGAFDIILYFCDSPDDVMKENLKIPKENFVSRENFNEEYINKIIDSQKTTIEKKGNSKSKHILLLFDDILSKQQFLKSKTMIKLVTECRHYNISCIFMSQSYTKIPRAIRINCRAIMLFPSSEGEIKVFSDENCLPNMTQKRFMKLIQHCTNEPYQFAFLQQDAPVSERLRKNFDIIIS